MTIPISESRSVESPFTDSEVSTVFADRACIIHDQLPWIASQVVRVLAEELENSSRELQIFPMRAVYEGKEELPPILYVVGDDGCGTVIYIVGIEGEFGEPPEDIFTREQKDILSQMVAGDTFYYEVGGE